MRFRDDTRGVTVQIGAVLFFATVIVALSLYQATVVPSQNADVEYRHSQAVQGDLADVRNSILETAASGNAQTSSVTLGTQYPSRVFLMNPPPATGTLSTGQYANNTIRVSNVRANDSETRDYIDGNWTAPTKYLSYTPNYNEYDGAPSRVYEASFLYNHYDDANVPLTDQLLVNDDTITLVALNGSTSTSQSGTVSVSAKPASAPYQSVKVGAKNASEPITISIPTRHSASQIRNATSLGDQAGVTVTDGGQNQVVVSLPPNRTYRLQTARVDVGSQQSNLGAHYLTVVDRDDDEVTVEARDRFNNPVSGVTVSVNGSNPFTSNSENTNVDGQATFEFTAGATGQGTLEILDGGEPRERVTVPAPAPTATGGGGQLVYLGNATAFDGGDTDSLTGGFNFTVRSDFGSNVTITDVSVVPENDDINGLSDKAPGEGPGLSELNVEGLTNGQNVAVDVPLVDAEYTYVGPRGLTLSTEQSREERVWDTGSGAFTTADTAVVGSSVELAPGGRAAITFAEFYTVSGGGATAVNVSNEDFRVVVSYRKDDAESSSEYVVYARPPSSDNGSGPGNQTSAEQTSYVDGSGSAARVGSENRVDLDIENTGSPDVTITGIQVSAQGGNIRSLLETRGGSGMGQHEVYIASTNPGLLEPGGSAGSGNEGNQAYQLGTQATLTEPATLSGGEQAQVALLEFRNNGGQTVSAAGEQLTVTLYFQDGSQTSFTFTPPGY